MNERKLIGVGQVQLGDIMAIVTFVRVEGETNQFGRSVISVNNLDNGLNFHVEGNDLIAQMYSADRYVSESAVTRTEMIERLISSYNRPFTATFEKRDGEVRILRGRLVSTEPLLGRSYVEDLDLPIGTRGKLDRLRQVDHRTLLSLIVDGIKFTLKKK